MAPSPHYRPCPTPTHKQLLLDLGTYLQCISNHDVILMLDGNEDIQPTSHLGIFLRNHGLLSIHETHHDDNYYDIHPVPRTFAAGTHKSTT